MTNKVEEEIRFGHRDDLVGDLNEQTETLSRFELQTIGYTLSKVFCSCARIYFEGFVSVVRDALFCVVWHPPRLDEVGIADRF